MGGPTPTQWIATRSPFRLDVPVHAVVRDTELAADEPLGERRLRPVQHVGERRLPGQPVGLLRPERQPVLLDRRVPLSAYGAAWAGPIALGRNDSRPGAGRAAQPLLWRGIRARPVCLSPSGRSRRNRPHGTGRAVPRRVAGADRRAPRGLHQLGRLPHQRGRPGGQPRPLGSPPTP